MERYADGRGLLDDALPHRVGNHGDGHDVLSRDRARPEISRADTALSRRRCRAGCRYRREGVPVWVAGLEADVPTPGVPPEPRAAVPADAAAVREAVAGVLSLRP
ncbi:hypothetical protein FHS33_000609 [Streptomyces calvus]|uniref:Uncharacterized protein n=1 Tax=Streptomyces calvus TaxID=67282 RepID=A0AA40S9Q8_9ACTN|nr:hypothetical protein [Streptomyces calvus]GGP51885.1 hypothetical protein GCM10010247_25660 [Streptomyces calvus]